MTLDLRDHVQGCQWGHASPGEQIVYALVDDADRVLYVGRSKRIAARLRQHSYDKPWWPQVADVLTVRVCCEDSASRTELHLMRALCPPFNIDPRDAARAGWVTRRGEVGVA